MNFARDVVAAAPPDDRALVELARDGGRRTWTFGQVTAASQGLAGALAARGAGRGDTVMTVIGNRPEWVLHDGRVLPSRRGGVAVHRAAAPKDLALRIATTGRA